MPKAKSSHSILLNRYCKEFQCFSNDGQVLTCTLCAVSISCERRSQVLQHLQTASHCKATSNAKHKQQLLTNIVSSSNPANDFKYDLTKALISADIPFHKLANPSLKSFFETYCKFDLPDQSTLRKGYVPKVFNDTMEHVKQKLAEKYIWVLKQLIHLVDMLQILWLEL